MRGQPQEKDNNRKRQLYDLYMQERSVIEGRISEQRSEFDRQLVNISTWAFGLTLVFFGSVYEKVAGKPSLFLYVGLSFLILTIAIVLISFQVSNHALRKYLDMVEAENIRHEKVEWEKPTKPHLWTKRLNRAAILTFLLGLISVFIYLIQIITKG